MTTILKKQSVFTVNVTSESCKGCGLCAAVCPAGILALGNEFNSKGYRYAVASGDCKGCGNCTAICPDLAIAVEKEF